MVDVLLIACLLVGAQFAAANLLARSLGRSRLKASEDESESSMKRCLRLRGGAADESTDSKVQGTCIGIDLGTTYRYSPLFPGFAIDGLSLLLPVAALQFGRMAAWKFARMSRAIALRLRLWHGLKMVSVL